MPRRAWYLMQDGNVVGILWGDDIAVIVRDALAAPTIECLWTVGVVDEYGGYLPGHPPEPSPRWHSDTPHTQPEEEMR